jgi:hypothetical protein
MKRLFLLLVLFTASNISFTQYLNQYAQYPQYANVENVPWRFWRDFNIHPKTSISTKERESLKTNHVKSREKTGYYKGVPSTTIEHFDTEGRIIRIEFSKKDYKSTSIIRYTEFGKIKEVEKTDSKSRISKTTYDYDSQNRLITTESVDFKKDYSKSEVAYNEFNKLSYRKHFNADTETPTKELRYSYHENGDKKETNYYVKGKLKHTWLFECKPEGELINVKEKDATKLCKLEDVDENGNYVVWDRKFDEKGRLTKEKTVFNSDTLLILRQRYRGTDKLVYEQVNSYDAENHFKSSIVKTFDKEKGLRLSSETTYSKEKGTLTLHYNKKGKVTHTNLYSYGKHGKPLKIQNTGSRWSSTNIYTYNEYDLIVSKIRMFGKKTFVHEYQYEYY